MSGAAAGAVPDRRITLTRQETWTRLPVWAGDTVLAAALAVPVATWSVSMLTEGRAPAHWLAGVLITVVVMHVVLVGRRTWSRSVFVVVALAEVMLTLAPDIVVPASPQPMAYAPIMLPSSVVFLFALYAVAAYGRRPSPVLALAIGVSGAGVVTARLAQQRNVGSGPILTWPWQGGFALAALLAAVLAAWSLGLARRMRAAHVDALRDRARRAEEQREERARAAAREERARIARELHDMVAHSLAVIVRQADAGRYAAKADPSVAEQVLDTVAVTGREALADMRGLLGVLRRDDIPDNTSDGDAGPQPALVDLPDLLDRVRTSGLAVALHEHGTRVPLDRAADLAAYRLVQEALTNVVKHAGAQASAEIHLHWDDGLTVTVTDTGGAARAGNKEPDGYGLVGMRERLHLAGGELTAGPREDGGFLVRGRLPARADQPAVGSVT